jgi:hypothetical protein
MRHGSDEYPLWRLQLDELQKDLQGATQRVLASLSISDMAPPPRPGGFWVAEIVTAALLHSVLASVLGSLSGLLCASTNSLRFAVP